VFIVFSCLGIVSCVFLCVIWFCLLVRQPSDWLGRLSIDSRGVFCVEGFPLQRPDGRVIYCYGLLYVNSQHVTLSPFSLISLFLTAPYFSKARYSLFVQKVPLNPNQAILCYILCSTDCLYLTLS